MSSTNHSLTQNAWTKIADYNGLRNYVRISDHSLSGTTIRVAFTENPFSYSFNNTDIDITNITGTPVSFQNATRARIEMNFRFGTPAAIMTLFSVSDASASGEYFYIYIDNADNKLVALLIDGGVTQWQVRSTNALAINTWHYMTFVHDSVEPKLFLGKYNKGQISGALSISTAPTAFLSQLSGVDTARIGGITFSSTIQRKWTGHIDFCKIMQGANSSAVGLYRFDEGTGTTLGDSFPEAKNGTITAGSGAWDETTKEKGENLIVNSDNYVEISNDEQPYIKLPIWCYTTGASDTVTLLQRKSLVA